MDLFIPRSHSFNKDLSSSVFISALFVPNSDKVCYPLSEKITGSELEKDRKRQRNRSTVRSYPLTAPQQRQSKHLPGRREDSEPRGGW